ncbi:reverse transcriptase domain-containing protein [Tanacetum coccineum]
MVPATASLIGFSGEIIWPLGPLSLLVKIRDEEHSTSTWMNFMVVRSSSPYNGIIGRPGVKKIQAVPSTAHGMLKFRVVGGILTLRSSKIIPIECAAASGPEGKPLAAHQAMEERIKVAINPDYPEQTIMIGSTLTEEGRNKLCDLLQRNLDEGCPSVRQKRRGQAADKNQAIQGEVKKLVDSDFKDLNKACPKDGYPLPEIDWKVESLCGFPFKCFMDRYKGYHQIKMAKEDEENTAFITSQGIFCYSKMRFGLRNVGATYQRLVDKAFHKQIDRNLEDVQNLNGRLSSLNRFLAKSAEKSLAFFKTLKKCTKKSDFYWIEEAKSAFKQMKQLIAELPTLTAPEEKEELIVYLAAAKEFDVLNQTSFPEVENKKADALSKITSTSFAHQSKQVLVEELKERSINKVEVLAVVEEEGNTWMTLIYEYLTERTLLIEVNKTTAVRPKSQRFAMINGDLYKKSFLGPWLRCVRPLQENYVLREIHEGSCSMHVGTRSVVAKALRTGYFWPTMHKDARALIRACQNC